MISVSVKKTSDSLDTKNGKDVTRRMFGGQTELVQLWLVYESFITETGREMLLAQSNCYISQQTFSPA